MALPPLLDLPDEAAYYAYWEWLCGSPFHTHDGVEVRIYPSQFKHAFYTKSARDPQAKKDTFDLTRAQRMDWIQYVLQETSLPNYRRETKEGLTRIFLEESTPYAVVIRPMPKDPSKALFITAYVIDRPGVVAAMQSNPPW